MRYASKKDIRKAIDKFFAEDKLDAIEEVVKLAPEITKAQLTEIEKKFA